MEKTDIENIYTADYIHTKAVDSLKKWSSLLESYKKGEVSKEYMLENFMLTAWCHSGRKVYNPKKLCSKGDVVKRYKPGEIVYENETPDGKVYMVYYEEIFKLIDRKSIPADYLENGYSAICEKLKPIENFVETLDEFETIFSFAIWQNFSATVFKYMYCIQLTLEEETWFPINEYSKCHFRLDKQRMKIVPALLDYNGCRGKDCEYDASMIDYEDYICLDNEVRKFCDKKGIIPLEFNVLFTTREKFENRIKEERSIVEVSKEELPEVEILFKDEDKSIFEEEYIRRRAEEVLDSYIHVYGNRWETLKNNYKIGKTTADHLLDLIMYTAWRIVMTNSHYNKMLKGQELASHKINGMMTYEKSTSRGMILALYHDTMRRFIDCKDKLDENYLEMGYSLICDKLNDIENIGNFRDEYAFDAWAKYSALILTFIYCIQLTEQEETWFPMEEFAKCHFCIDVGTAKAIADLTGSDGDRKFENAIAASCVSGKSVKIDEETDIKCNVSTIKYEEYICMDDVVQEFCSQRQINPLAFGILLSDAGLKRIRLTKLREDKALSQRELAKLSGLDEKTISRFELGITDINNAAARSLYKLSKALDCSMEDLMEIEREF